MGENPPATAREPCSSCRALSPYVEPFLSRALDLHPRHGELLVLVKERHLLLRGPPVVAGPSLTLHQRGRPAGILHFCRCRSPGFWSVASTALGDHPVTTAKPVSEAGGIWSRCASGVLDVGCGPGTVTAYLAERGLDVAGVDLSPRMIENARRLHPECRFSVASATDLDLDEASLGGVLGWWSLFNLPRNVLPQVLALFARALKPGGHFITATHVGDEDAVRTEAYGGVPVRWTTHKWRPEQLVDLIEQAGLRPVAELRLPADEQSGPGVVIMAKQPG
ncbi:methyltransferase domain-containing protein [Streptomyces sp. NPDC001852]|uniref:class I SAM-dependent methyltransferase n=1 Tax=Streptomyces sp. NPDC001852 TaxID=3364619 RepID=UPI0036CE5306